MSYVDEPDRVGQDVISFYDYEDIDMLDLHVHILPGFDDGAGDSDTELLMARLAEKDGITHLVATPHIITGGYHSTRGEILEAVDSLNQTLADHDVSVKVLPGGEFRMEPELPRKLAAGELMTLNDTGRYLLVEMPATLVPGFTGSVLYELQLQGVTPIIAHPERNAGFAREPELLGEMVKRGILTQITAGSLTGMFGREAHRAALTFLAKGWGHIIASDAHSATGRIPMLSAAAGVVTEQMGAEVADLLVAENPRRIIEGREIIPLEPRKPSFRDKVLSKFFRRRAN